MLSKAQVEVLSLLWRVLLLMWQGSVVIVAGAVVKVFIIAWKSFVNKNNICEIIMLANRNNIHKRKRWQIGIRTYS